MMRSPGDSANGEADRCGDAFKLQLPFERDLLRAALAEVDEGTVFLNVIEWIMATDAGRLGWLVGYLTGSALAGPTDEPQVGVDETEA